MNKHGAIGVRELHSREVTIHAAADPGGAGYQTLCGLAVDGDLSEEVPIAVNTRIECATCFSVWREAHRFTLRNFKR